MNKIIKKIVIIIIIIILILIINDYYKIINLKEKDNIIYKKILYNDLYNKIKTGDLILFSNYKKSILNTTFCTNIFSHIGIIIIIKKEPYICEIINNKNYLLHKNVKRNKTDISIFKLKNRIKYYTGNVYISILKNKLTKNQLQKLKNKINNDKKIYKFPKYYELIYSFLFSKTLINKRFCTEYIAELINELEIDTKIFKQKKINISKEILKICNNTTYSYPIQIINEELLIDKNKINLYNESKIIKIN